MIGDLNRRITIQYEELTPDGAGGFIGEWKKLENQPEVYASIIPLSSGEVLHYRQLSHVVNYQINIRYRNDIKANMRIVHDEVIYNIKSVIDIKNQSRYLKILAEADE